MLLCAWLRQLASATAALLAVVATAAVAAVTFVNGICRVLSDEW
jgi:hypothetical protein